MCSIYQCAMPGFLLHKTARRSGPPPCALGSSYRRGSAGGQVSRLFATAPLAIQRKPDTQHTQPPNNTPLARSWRLQDHHSLVASVDPACSPLDMRLATHQRPFQDHIGHIARIIPLNGAAASNHTNVRGLVSTGHIQPGADDKGIGNHFFGRRGVPSSELKKSKNLTL